MKKATQLLTLICLASTILGQDATVIYKNTVNSTVTIETDISLGSGFFVGDKMVVTNYHVVEGAKNAFCYNSTSSTKYKIEGYVAVDKSLDLIILKVSGLSIKPIKMAMDSISPGQIIYAIGSPKGLPATISDGIVSGLREFDKHSLIQITAPISPGSSGGPVLNSKGEVIGVSVGQLKDGQNLNFAIPVIYVQRLMTRLFTVKPITNFGKPLLVDIKSESNTIFNKKDKPFNIVKIGSQIWMAENLKVTRFRNGDIIPEAKTSEDWVKAYYKEEPIWCYYKNDPINGEKFGKIYNRYAVKDPRGLAPEGWHIPNDEEWIDLINFLDGEENAGNKIKSTSGWPKNGNGTNSSGFKGLPGGFREGNGIFEGIGNYANWWSISLLKNHNSNDNKGFGCRVKNPSAYIFSELGNMGAYVRCLKD